jgi:hypothetical protein
MRSIPGLLPASDQLKETVKSQISLTQFGLCIPARTAKPLLAIASFCPCDN